jgi:hypothetical protein
MKKKVLPMACALLLLQSVSFAQDAQKTSGPQNIAKSSPKTAKVNTAKKLPYTAHLNAPKQVQQK